MPKVDISYCDMPLRDGDSLSNPALTAFQFLGVSERCHIWQIAYPQIKGTKNARSKNIELGPIANCRLPAIETIARVISEKMIAGLAPKSAASMLVSVKSFSIWTFGKRRWEALWIDRDATETLVGQYIRDCEAGKISVAHSIPDVLRFARDMFDDYFLPGVRAPKRPEPRAQVVSEDKYRTFVATTNQLFEACCDVVLNTRPFPYEVALPDQSIWLLPTKANTPKDGSYEVSKVWDFRTGRQRTIEEVAALSRAELKNPLSVSRSLMNKALRDMRAVNSSPRHARRKAIASLGCCVFASMFSTQTGANQGVQLALEFDPKLAEKIRSSQVVRVKYREIKLRAGNREVGIVLGIEFVPQFLKYLELRAFIVGNAHLSNLFVQCDKSSNPIPIQPGWVKNVGNWLVRNGIPIDMLASQALRLKKRVHQGEKLPPQEASDFSNHSKVTALRDYSKSNLVRQATAVGGYLAHLDVVVGPASARDDSLPSCSGGSCTAPGNPAPSIQGAPKELKCGDGEGCLFCDKLRLFADEADARKLLSCQAVLEISGRRLDPSSEAFRAFTVTHDRIESLIEMLREREPELVSRVVVEVREHEMFDAYWAAKAEQLALLGVY